MNEFFAFLTPEAASTVAASSDWLFNFINAVSLFFFVLIIALMVIFVVRYRRTDPTAKPAAGAHHNLPLELTWSIVPSFIVVFMAYKGIVGYMDVMTPPVDAYQIQVQARQWGWDFVYPNGTKTPHLYAPVNTPVVLTMRSDDVLHSFFVPQFRVKMDVVPGKYSKAWFEATKVTGLEEHFDLWCAEYCGLDHSRMIARVHILDAKGFEQWLADSEFDPRPPAAKGADHHKRLCQACHTVDGSAKVGPSWLGLFGRQGKGTKGESYTADENYIRESILNPNAIVVEGFTPGTMNSFQGQVSEDEIIEIIEYMKTLKP